MLRMGEVPVEIRASAGKGCIVNTYGFFMQKTRQSKVV